MEKKDLLNIIEQVTIFNSQVGLSSQVSLTSNFTFII